MDKLKESGKVSPEFAAKLEQMKGAHTVRFILASAFSIMVETLAPVDPQNGLEIFPIWVAGIVS